MEAILKFNLPEENEEFNTAVNSSNYKNALWEINQFLRNKSKWSLYEKESEISEKLREELFRIMSENNVILD
jgi:hypothetical protein